MVLDHLEASSGPGGRQPGSVPDLSPERGSKPGSVRHQGCKDTRDPIYPTMEPKSVRKHTKGGIWHGFLKTLYRVNKMLLYQNC